MNELIYIVGPYPPPYGGISVHIERMGQILSRAGIPYRIYNHGFSTGPHVLATRKSAFWYITFFFSKKAQVIHFHQFFSFHYVYFFFLTLFSKSKLIVTIHDEAILSSNTILRRFLLFFIRRTGFAALISVSQNLSEYFNKRKISNLVLPAYVPPTVDPVNLKKISGKEYFLYSIWKLEKSIAGKIYNIELAFKLLSKIKDSFHMLFLIGSKESDEELLSQLIETYGVRESITVVYERQLVDYLPNCSFLLRTNNEDGYGVSLQEALDLGVPAIATDVCVRPKGTVLFKAGNVDDLMDKVKNLDKYWDEKSIETPRYHERLLEIYRQNLK